MSEPGVCHDSAAAASRFRRGALGALALVAAGFGCASSQGGVQRLADGSYRVQCERPLLSCLEPAAKLCELHGYDIVSATEDRERYGPSPWQLDVVKSSATLRCRKPAPFTL